MLNMLKKIQCSSLALLALSASLFTSFEVSAGIKDNSDKALRYQVVLNQSLNQNSQAEFKGSSHEDCHHKSHCKKGLTFALNAALFNISGSDVSGTVTVKVYNPEGKETFLGRIPFNLAAGNNAPLVLAPKRARDSDDFGLYTTVIDIACDAPSSVPFSLNIIGEVVVVGLKTNAATSVNFFDIDFASTAPHLQVTVPYYYHTGCP